MNPFKARIARNPKPYVVVGKGIFLVGAILILGAVFARAGLMNVNAQRAEAKQPVLRTLAEAYPQYPTWIVPEGPVGFTIAGVLVLAGMALVVLGTDAIKRDELRKPKW
ncbi:hypothetical protein [Ramlibacter sp.]|uniref:hypothetical protein n=1 Tax=Ramlibacter sp. TaxID=1917967 RepID=UPI003D11B7C0